MTDDPELWALFRAEAEEHLQILDSGLLRLEKDAADRATLEAVFRSAHSLKGAARMMGAAHVEQGAHGFEDALAGALRRGETLAETTIERLYRDLDALRASVNQAVSGQSPAHCAREERCEESPLDELSSADEEAPIVREVSPEVERVAPMNGEVASMNGQVNGHALPGAPVGEAGVLAPLWKIETMRVDTARLDGLMAMAGELVVSTKRAGRGKAEFERAQILREDVQKLGGQQKRMLRLLEEELGEHSPVLRDLEGMLKQMGAKWDALSGITERLRGAHEDMARLENVVGELEEAIRAVRLLPLSTLFSQFPRSVRDLAKAQNKRVELQLQGAETLADKRVLEELKDPLMHMVRNAVDHGIEAPITRIERGKTPEATLTLRGSQTATHIVIELEDDGRGLDAKAIGASALSKGLLSADELEAMSPRQIQDLIFSPGFSTAAQLTDVSGRGVGLDVVRENVARLRGTIEVESTPGRGCIFRLVLPLTLATTRVLLVRVGAQTFALPIERVSRVFLLEREATFALQSRPTFALDGEPIPVASLANLLQIAPDETTETGAQPCVVTSEGNERLGLCVDAVVEEQEIILKPLSSSLAHLKHIAGATILETGDVCLLLSPAELSALATGQSATRAPQLAPNGAKPARPKALLLAEDSIVTRTQEKRILEGAGYTVVTAVDGLDGWQKLSNGEFDGVISDVEMPHLNGFDLTARIRSHPQYDELPIVLVTSLASDNDRRRGLEVGANAYIAKGEFDQKVLLETLEMLV